MAFEYYRAYGDDDYDPELEGIDLDEYDEADDSDSELGLSDIADFSSGTVNKEVPTSSSNVSRPRTVAAAYAPNEKNPEKGTLTVVFRDGTVWNYPNVSPGEWANFHASISKGRPWINNQVFGRGEPAPIDRLSPEVQAFVATQRLAQARAATKYKYKAGTTTISVRRTLKSGQVKTYTYTKDVFGQRTKVTNEIRARRRQAGKNPATANKPKRP